jgi:nitrate/nitrite transporter NarK
MRVLRSISVVILGYLIFGGTAALLFQLSGQEPHSPASIGFKVITIIYGMVFAAAGGWVASRLGGQRPLGHAGAVATLIALGAVISLLFSGTANTWSMWFALLLMAPSALLGGWIRKHSFQKLSSDQR